MSLNPSNSDWLEEALESTRRNVRQLEIDACRIRTDLARIEVANAAGVSNGDVTAAVREEEPETRQLSQADKENHLSIGASDVLDWQPAGSNGPEGMEILIGAPVQAGSQ